MKSRRSSALSYVRGDRWPLAAFRSPLAAGAGGLRPPSGRFSASRGSPIAAGRSPLAVFGVRGSGARGSGVRGSEAPGSSGFQGLGGSGFGARVFEGPGARGLRRSRLGTNREARTASYERESRAASGRGHERELRATSREPRGHQSDNGNGVEDVRCAPQHDSGTVRWNWPRDRGGDSRRRSKPGAIAGMADDTRTSGWTGRRCWCTRRWRRWLDDREVGPT